MRSYSTTIKLKFVDNCSICCIAFFENRHFDKGIRSAFQVARIDL